MSLNSVLFQGGAWTYTRPSRTRENAEASHNASRRICSVHTPRMEHIRPVSSVNGSRLRQSVPAYRQNLIKLRAFPVVSWSHTARPRLGSHRIPYNAYHRFQSIHTHRIEHSEPFSRPIRTWRPPAVPAYVQNHIRLRALPGKPMVPHAPTSNRIHN